eukprot:138315_1
MRQGHGHTSGFISRTKRDFGVGVPPKSFRLVLAVGYLDLVRRGMSLLRQQTQNQIQFNAKQNMKASMIKPTTGTHANTASSSYSSSYSCSSSTTTTNLMMYQHIRQILAVYGLDLAFAVD